jgi:hypothetical protein
LCYRYTIPQELLNDINDLVQMPAIAAGRMRQIIGPRWCAVLLARSGPWQAGMEGCFGQNCRQLRRLNE